MNVFLPFFKSSTLLFLWHMEIGRYWWFLKKTIRCIRWCLSLGQLAIQIRLILSNQHSHTSNTIPTFPHSKSLSNNNPDLLFIRIWSLFFRISFFYIKSSNAIKWFCLFFFFLKIINYLFLLMYSLVVKTGEAGTILGGGQ